MNITEYAIAKKLFGGGGGKKEGTAIPADGTPVDTIYFNTNLTIAETDALLSQLTYVQTPLLSYPLYAIYANTTDGNVGSFVIAVKLSNGKYEMCEIRNISASASWTFYDSAAGDKYDFNTGFLAKKGFGDSDWLDGVPITKMHVYPLGQALTDFNGIPVGAENEKIKNMLSITPF